MTISDLCADLGTRQPVKPRHAKRICAECGSDDFGWMVETTRSRPNGTGYMVLACEVCGEAVLDDGTTQTRTWVGW
jgi:hypothetical protein